MSSRGSEVVKRNSLKSCSLSEFGGSNPPPCMNFVGGFYSGMEFASVIIKGMEIYYNFIRKHQGINCCPYELAIPDLELGKNRWLDLIKMIKV